MRDDYKVRVIDAAIKDMENDEYCLTRLGGDDTKYINIDVEALNMLKTYYEGKQMGYNVNDNVTPIDSYKSSQIEKMIESIKDDEYYLARLHGDNTKAINIDEYGLEILKAYYDGMEIKVEEIDAPVLDNDMEI